ncbi:hypothetical protein NBRC116602_00530 [Hyphomicrobiales bacterium 4NK60-0047b]
MKFIIIGIIVIIAIIGSFIQRRKYASDIKAAGNNPDLWVKANCESSHRSKGVFKFPEEIDKNTISWNSSPPENAVLTENSEKIRWNSDNGKCSYHFERSWQCEDKTKFIQRSQSHIVLCGHYQDPKDDPPTKPQIEQQNLEEPTKPKGFKHYISSLKSQITNLTETIFNRVSRLQVPKLSLPTNELTSDTTQKKTAPLISKLENKTQYLKQDAFWLSGTILVTIFANLIALKLKITGLIFFLLHAFLTLYLLLLIVSFILRVTVKRRLNPLRTLIATFIAAPFLHFSQIFLSVFIREFITDYQTADILAYISSILFLIISVPIILFIGKKIKLTKNKSLTILKTVSGLVMCDILFLAALGPKKDLYFWFEWGGSSAPIGLISTLIVVFIITMAYLLQRKQPSSMMIFIAGGLSAGLILRALVDVHITTQDLLKISTDLSDFVFAGICGALLGSGALMLKRVYVDQDHEARQRFVRTRGGLYILYAVMPVFILLFVASSLNSFINNATIETAAIEHRISLLKYDAHRAKRHLNAYKRRMNERVEDVVLLAKQVKIDIKENTKLVKDEVERNVKVAQKVAIDVADKAVGQLAETGKEISNALSSAFTIPDIPTPFGDIPVPDLGIGDAIKNAVLGLFPDLKIENLFSGFITSMTADVEAQLAEPIERAEKIKNHLIQTAKARHQRLKDIERQAGIDLDNLISGLKYEKQNAYRHMRQSITHFVNIAYHFLVFLFFLVSGMLAFLVWRAINALAIMMERIDRGWTMFTKGQDPEEENLKIA